MRVEIDLEIDMKNYFNKFIERATKEKVYFTEEQKEKMWNDKIAELKGTSVSAMIYIPEYKLVNKKWFNKLKKIFK